MFHAQGSRTSQGLPLLPASCQCHAIGDEQNLEISISPLWVLSEASDAQKEGVILKSTPVLRIPAVM